MKARRVPQAPPPPPDLIVLEMTLLDARKLRRLAFLSGAISETVVRCEQSALTDSARLLGDIAIALDDAGVGPERVWPS